MEIYVIISIILFLAVFIMLLVRKKSPKPDQSALMIQQQLDSLRKQLEDGLKNNTETVNRHLVEIIEQVNKQLNTVTGQMISTQKTMGERLDNATNIVTQVQKGLGSLSQATERIFEVGKDISSLQEILRAPKIRGNLGELFLGDLLSQILPQANYTLQYSFKSGEQVDAVIRLGQGLVPVDSKFPLENFKRIIETQDEPERKAMKKKFTSDVKKHVDAIAKKYILPDEGTFDFALMYIPAENVYYETIIKDEDETESTSISGYALKKKVIPVSPNSFYAYLQAIVLGLRGMHVEKSAETIIRHLSRLKGDFSRFQEDFDVLGKHVTNIKSKYDESARRLERFSDKLLNTTDSKTEALKE
ncbi:MAG: DNA recombination protein RmuC [Endomicrobiales bacterium]|nr:DNA recombination protein RmuC [Endomicrobiales bacterium]